MALDPWLTPFANSYCYTPVVNFGRGIAHEHDETLLRLLSLDIVTPHRHDVSDGITEW
jgi:hypothetical protein